MRKLAKQIIDTKMPESTMTEIKEMFFQLMRERGIKQGTETKGGGRICDNPEWTMAKEFFLENMKSQINFDLILNHIPDDLKV